MLRLQPPPQAPWGPCPSKATSLRNSAVSPPPSHTHTHNQYIYICISWSKNLFVPQQQKEFEDNLDNPHGDDWRKEQICAAATQEQKQEKKEKRKESVLSWPTELI